MEDWCGVLGRLCGGQGEMIVCYLCLDEVHFTVWSSGEHRKQCASRNTAQLSSFPIHPTSTCTRCGAKLKLWPAQGPGFSCDSQNCPNKSKLVQSTGENRYNCFPCDYDLCKSCCSSSETTAQSKPKPRANGTAAKQNGEVVVKEDENQNNREDVSKRTSILNDDDNIPLIDVQSSSEDIPELISLSSRRPKSASVSQRPTAIDARSRSIASLGLGSNPDPHTNLLAAKKRVADSPDIFNLRAPLVSCENFLTPATSKEALNQPPAD